jgi:lipoyl(octanoyl) transferase
MKVVGSRPIFRAAALQCRLEPGHQLLVKGRGAGQSDRLRTGWGRHEGWRSVYFTILPVTTSPLPARVLDLGLRDFGAVWEMQRELVAARQRDEIPDTLVLVEHPDVITLGRGTRRENLLRPDDMPVFEIERGGDVTYHGPGQLVGYPIFLLRQHERDLHKYLRDLEEAMIRALGQLGLPAGREPGWTGVWTTAAPARKLASIGVAVKKWVTLHGFALNVSTDLGRFTAINPCGLEASVMTSVSACLGRAVTLDEVAAPLVRQLGLLMNRRFQLGEDAGQDVGAPSR